MESFPRIEERKQFVMPLNSKEVEKAIREIIASKQPGKRLASARALAAEVGAGRTAVNHVITRLVGEGSLLRVGRKLIIGSAQLEARSEILLIGGEDEQLRAAAETFARHGATATIRKTVNENGRRMLLLEVCGAPVLPDGLLVFGPGDEDLLIDLESRGVAVVVCDAEVEALSFVASDRSQCTAQAVMRLAALGHREIALLLRVGQNFPEKRQVVDGYVATTRAHQLHRSAGRVVVTWSKRKAQQSLRAFFRSKTPVTAVISWDLEGAILTLEEARKIGQRVPRDLSVVALQENTRAVGSSPSLTTLDVDHRGLARFAAAVLCDELHQMSRVMEVRRHQGIICRPIWKLRASMGPADRAVAEPVVPLKRSRRWPDSLQERLSVVASENSRQFPKIGRSRARYKMIDLGPHLNRAFAPRSAWLGGDPLRNFKTGVQEIHGVPFQIGNSNDHRKPSAVVLRSAKARSSAGESLPSSVTITLGEAGKPWRALHILHASGWNSQHEKVATYELRSKSKTLVTRDVFALGEVSAAEQIDQRAQYSLVQDWHSSAEPFASQEVLPHLITEQGDPLRYERYLYHVRILNPGLEIPLEFFQLATERPDARATLALLALTVEY